MANLFGVDFRSLFAGAMGGLLLPMTLKIRTPGTYSATDPSAGPTDTEVSYSCKGSVNVVEKYQDGDLVRIRDAEAVVLLGTISTAGIRPKPGDVLVVTIPGGTATQDCDIIEAGYDDAGAAVVLKLKG